jgi:uncharacterized cupredoxin-like copper-binding protein
MQILRRPPSTRTLLSIASLTAFLFLSACSFGAHSGAEGHGHEESEEHHDDAKEDHHDGEDDHHGDEGGDHHESMAGMPGNIDNITRTIAVDMADSMSYTPAGLTVKAGETIRFTVKNSGQLVHEFVLGATEEILEHHELMKRFPGMEHDEPNSVSLKANESGDVVWQFTKAGTFQFACLQPGHYEAGMKGDVVVSAQ